MTGLLFDLSTTVIAIDPTWDLTSELLSEAGKVASLSHRHHSIEPFVASYVLKRQTILSRPHHSGFPGGKEMVRISGFDG